MKGKMEFVQNAQIYFISAIQKLLDGVKVKKEFILKKKTSVFAKTIFMMMEKA